MPKIRMTYVDDNDVERASVEMPEQALLAASNGPMSIYCAGVHDISDLWTELARKIAEMKVGGGMMGVRK